MNRNAPAIPPTLNDRQVALWLSEPAVADRAVDAVLACLGPRVAREGLVPIAKNATLEAAATFDAAHRVPYAQWAFFLSSYRVWEHLERGRAGDPELRARIRAGMFRFMARHERFLDLWTQTPRTTRESLTALTDAMLFSAAVEITGNALPVRGEADVVAVERATRFGEAVRQVIEGLSPEQRHMLQRCAAWQEPVTRFAREAKRSYHAVLDEYHEVLALCAARLTGLGFADGGGWIPRVSGEIFDEPPPHLREVPAANDEVSEGKPHRGG